ncbi:MAG: DUF1207 domain-containing protein [Planctomycetes bacterium]|nr:DUF1207 domain-containing protein [Planctomycetota bacterium]
MPHIVCVVLLALQPQPPDDGYGYDFLGGQKWRLDADVPAAAAQDGEQEGLQDGEDERLLIRPVVAERWRTEWFPAESLYGTYLADPVSPRSGSKVMMPVRKKDNIRVENCLGTQRTFFRRADPVTQEGFDVGIEGAVLSRFDYDENWDIDAADYRFGFPIGYRQGRISGKFHIWHLTSHRGDEYMSRTGSRAIRYHKDEVAVAMAYDVTPELRVYVDAGWGFYIGTPNEPWRFQLGWEWVGQGLWEDAPRTFVACDLKWREETADWALNLQTGWWLVQDVPGTTAGVRILLEYYRGMAAQTQFPDERNHYWALGFAAGF